MVPDVVFRLKYFSPALCMRLMWLMAFLRSFMESMLFLPILSTWSYSSGTSKDATWLAGLILVMTTISLMLLVLRAASRSSMLLSGDTSALSIKEVDRF